MKVWRHIKSEGVYYELGRSVWNTMNVVIYISRQDHVVWVRSAKEFDDGRFAFLGLTENVIHQAYPLKAIYEADLRPLLISEDFSITEVQAA